MAGKAGLILVLARSNPDRSLGHKGLSMFLVEKDVYEGHDFEYRQPQGGLLTGRAIATIGLSLIHIFAALEHEQKPIGQRLEDPAFYQAEPQAAQRISLRLTEIDEELLLLLERWEALEG